MKQGVILDIERREMKKTQNLRLLQEQIEITKRLKKNLSDQNVSNNESKET